MQDLAQKLLNDIRRQRLMMPGDRVGVAVSGGADSVALLRLMRDLRRELGVVLSVVHFNHQLRGAESDNDEQFVAELAGQHKLQLHAGRGDVRRHAAQNQLSLEAAARQMRYEFFCRLLSNGIINRIATAHTLDDQAETVLLRIARGTGTRGLAGIYPRVAIDASGHACVVRPLLGIERKKVHDYLRATGQGWREDPSNRDLRHARNRVRHGILPRLERHLNPSVRQTLAETAEIARAEEEYWEGEVARLLPQVWPGESRRLRLAPFSVIPLALRRRMLRAVAESLGIRLEFGHVDRILEIASSETESAKATALPDGWMVSQEKENLLFHRGGSEAREYEYRLQVPGEIDVPELRMHIETVVIPPGSLERYNPDLLLCSGVLGKELIIRNWRPGDRFWPSHTKAPKKIKELLAERHITGEQRKLWPVIASADEIVWVRGFPGPAHLAARESDSAALLIRESEIIAADENSL